MTRLLLRLLGKELARVGAIEDAGSLGHFHASLAGSTWAEDKGKIDAIVADHGSHIVGQVVGGITVRVAGRAVNHGASRVRRVVQSRGNNLHATSAEGSRITVNVGDVVGDLAVGPGEFELGDGSVGGGIGRQLDGDADARLAVGLRI